jgi:hypothetical protein
MAGTRRTKQNRRMETMLAAGDGKVRAKDTGGTGAPVVLPRIRESATRGSGIRSCHA